MNYSKSAAMGLLAVAAAMAAVLSDGQHLAAANLGVTPGTSPVVGITLGTNLVLVPVNPAPGPVWGNAGGYNTAANGGAGGYFPTATNVLISAGGYSPMQTQITAVSPPPYNWGSSASLNATGATALTLPGTGASIAEIGKYNATTVPPEVVYDFAPSSSNYASLTNTLTTPPPQLPDVYDLGSGAHSGYVLASPENVSLNAAVSPSSAGVTWSPTTNAVGPTDDTYSAVHVSTGAIGATNNGTAGMVGRTRLVWSASGVVGNVGFVEFGLNGAITAGPVAAKGPIGAGPIGFDLQGNLNGPPTGLLTTGSGADQITLTIPGTGTNSSSQTFANGDFVGEGYSVTALAGGGYGDTIWAVSLSSTFTLNPGADLAGTATATIIANTGGDSFALDPTQLPANYSGDAPGFSYFAVPEPATLGLPALVGMALLMRRRRLGSRAGVAGVVGVRGVTVGQAPWLCGGGGAGGRGGTVAAAGG